MKKRFHRLNNLIFVFFLLALVAPLAARSLHYTAFIESQGINQFIGEFLDFQKSRIIRTLFFINFNRKVLLVVLPALLLLPLIFRRWFFYGDEGRWGIRGWVYLAVWPVVITFHFIFDINPYISTVAFVTIPFLVFDRIFPKKLNAPLLNALMKWSFIPVMLIFLPFATNSVDILAVILLGGFFFIIKRWGFRLFFKENLFLSILTVPLPQIFASIFPLLVPLHGGTMLGEDPAYSFCESPKNGHIFVSVPQCSAMSTPEEVLHEKPCKKGYIAEYDRDLSLVEKHRLFSDSFYGRIEMLECMEDSVVGAVTILMKDGEFFEENVVEMFPEKRAIRLFFDKFKYMGSDFVYDEKNDVLFFVSENTSLIFKYDRKTDTVDRTVGDVMRKYGALSNITDLRAIHYGRGSFFATEWFKGSRVYEISTTTSELLNLYHTDNGGGVGIVVDEELDRLYVAGFWGLDVLDIKSTKPVDRIRTGFITRTPAIDKKRNLIFVPSTMEGKIRVLDRNTLELLKTIPIGYEVRKALISKDWDRLFVGTKAGSFYWRIDELMKN